MTYFYVGMTLTCPSDWNAQKCRDYIERFVITKQERDTLLIFNRDAGITEAEHFRRAIQRIRHIKEVIPFDAADAATECIRIAKEALGEK